MKKTLSLALAAILCQVLLSCDSGFPYKPESFNPPPPIPRPNFATGNDVKSFCGTDKVVLFYAREVADTQAAIFCTNFEGMNDSVPVPVKLKRPSGGLETWAANSPMPSPNGKLVAYHMFNRLKATQAKAYIQKVNATDDPILIADPGSDPHFFKAANGDLFVTYTDTSSILPVGDLTKYTARATYKVKVDSVTGIPDPSTKTKIVDFPMYGGLSPDGNYISTGYANAGMYSFTDTKFHPINQGIQTCNPSTSTDPAASDKMMFLNIGGKQNLLGNPYTNGYVGEHLAVFIVNAMDSVINYFDLKTMVGSTQKEWQCPEWSNNPDYFAVLATDDNAQLKFDVYMVKISTKSVLRLNIPANLKLDGRSTPYVYFTGGAS
jgi:hypothetical protein